jgi:hypothetical protein
MPTASETKVVTGPVRLSYVHLFEAWANDDSQELRFSVTLLIPKSDKRTLAAIEKARQAAITAKWGAKPPKALKNTLHDGDDEDKFDHEKNPECAGHMVMACASKTRPGVVDRQLQPIIDSTEVYSGCYARVSINAFAYEHPQGGKGTSFGLNHVMKWEDGDFLGGRSRAEDDFADIAEMPDVDGDASDLL